MRIFTAAILTLALTPLAEGQGLQARFTAGTTAFADNTTVNQPTVGGSLRVYFSKRWSVEPELLYSSRRFDRNTFLWGNVGFDFLARDRRIVPYWYASPGFVRHTTKFAINFSNTEAAFATGAGVRLRLTDRVFVAPQVRFGVADGVFGAVTGSIGYIITK